MHGKGDRKSIPLFWALASDFPADRLREFTP